MAQAVVAVPQAVATPPKAFKPYGSPPPFDLEAERDSFPVWLERWNIFLALSTIDEVLDAAAQPAYKTNQLKSCLSTPTLQAVLSAGLTAAKLADHVAIIDLLRTRCNAGRNRHVWRHQFAVCSQLPNKSADNWLCSLRDLSRKCDFNQDCCGNCEPTRILGQIISGVEDNAVRIKLLEKGDGLTLDQAIAILRSAETSRLQAASLQQTDYAINAIRRSTYKCNKDNTDVDRKVRFDQDKKSSEKSTTASCRYCGGPRRHSKSQCPAYGKECDNCGKDNHFAAVCEGTAKSVRSIHIQQVTSTSNDESVLIQIAALPNGPTLCTKGLPDTGSQLDAIPHSMYHTSFANIPLLPGAQACTAIGSEIECLGSFKATIDWKADDGISRPVPTTIHVLENLQQPVLCTATQRNLGMLPVKYPHARLHSISADCQFEPSESQKETDLAAIMAEVPRVFDGVCRIMAGPPCHLALKDGAIPVKIRGSRPISEPLKAPFRDELATQVKQGIIRKVRPDEVTPWIHGVVVIPKKQGGIRFCPDYRPLSKWLIGAKFDNPTPFQAVRSIPQGMKFFTVVDALKGYHQCELDEESRSLTTFATPEGLHQYTRLPMGINHAGDDYGRRFSDIFGHIPNMARCMEVLVVYSSSYKEHVALVRDLCKTAIDNNVSFNKKKTAFAKKIAIFAGCEVSSNGFRPNPELTRAIRDFPRPSKITDLRSFYGLCQQVGNFSDQIATALSPLSALLKKSTSWEWTVDQEEAFCAARTKLATVSDLAFYDPCRPTSLAVDASLLNGLGFLLKQKNDLGVWHIVQAGSRFLRSPETRYAMIELECLAASWAMKQCRQFLEGLSNFDLVTDHRPLIPILNEYSLDKLDNPRLLRLRLKMARYNFIARWVPGNRNIEADALSRSPISRGMASDELGEGPQSFTARVAVVGIIAESPDVIVDATLEKVRRAVAADPVLTALRATVLEGFPNDKCNLPLALRPFWNVRHGLAIDDSDDMLVYGPRIVLPRILVKDTLQTLLSMHQGASKMRQRARLSMYWPNMDVDITNAASTCEECVSQLPSLPAEPLKKHQPATRPFEIIHTDIGEVDGRHFLVIVDQFSGWPAVTTFPDKHTTARRLINVFRDFFLDTGGAPVMIYSDNSPFKAAEFQLFLKDWGISFGSSSPHYHKSNGRAEASIKSMTKLVKGSRSGGQVDPDKLAKAILLFRNAPRYGGASPAQLVFNRPVRDGLPNHRRFFAPKWQRAAHALEERTKHAIEKNTDRYNQSTSPLEVFPVGAHVLAQHPTTKRWDTQAIVVETDPNRDYIIKTASGRLLRRNRRFLRQRVVVMPATNPPAAQIAPAQPPMPAAPAPPNPPAAPARLNPPEVINVEQERRQRQYRPRVYGQASRRSNRPRNAPKRYPA